MQVDKRRQEKLANSLATTLQRAGIVKFRGVVLLVEVEDASSPSGLTVMGSMSGDHQSIASMLVQQLRRMVAEPTIITPIEQPAAAPPSKGN